MSPQARARWTTPNMSIAPPPVHISTTTLYAGTIAALVVAISAAALAFSYLLCESDMIHRSDYTSLLAGICKDDHYKYLVSLLVPTTAWFVIANWVGWEFFRNA